MDGRVVFTGLMPHAPILVPGVGREHSTHVGTTAHAMELVARHALAADPDTIVLISPTLPDAPWHFTAFHPDYKMRDISPTPVATLVRARDLARARD